MEGKEREIEGRGCGSFNKPRLEFYFLFKMREGFEGITFPYICQAYFQQGVHVLHVGGGIWDCNSYAPTSLTCRLP